VPVPAQLRRLGHRVRPVPSAPSCSARGERAGGVRLPRTLREERRKPWLGLGFQRCCCDGSGTFHHGLSRDAGWQGWDNASVLVLIRQLRLTPLGRAGGGGFAASALCSASQWSVRCSCLSVGTPQDPALCACLCWTESKLPLHFVLKKNAFRVPRDVFSINIYFHLIFQVLFEFFFFLTFSKQSWP